MNIPFPSINFAVVLPQVILSVTAILVLLMGLVIPRKNHIYMAILSLIGIILAMSFTVLQPIGSQDTFNHMAIADGFSSVFNIIFFLSCAFVILLSIPFLDKERVPESEYYSLLLFATVGMMLMAGTTDLIIIFLGLELMSISLYILATITRLNTKANEAGMKYLLLGSFAAAFLLYGIAFIYGATGSTNLTSIITYLKTVPPTSNGWMLPVGVGLIIVGLGFKIGLVPFHSWIPDVYEGSPTVVTAFMSIGPKAAGFAALLRVLFSGPFLPNIAAGIEWQSLLAGLAGLTMTIGNLVALAQGNIKRMLAYSSIAHAGYIMLGLVTANQAFTPAVQFYFFAYLFMNLGAFAVVYAVQQEEGKGNTLKQYTALGYRKPMLALAMTLFMLSLSGFPPTAGFMGKFYLFRSAVGAGFTGLVIVAVLNSVVSAYYYLRVVVYMYMRDVDESITLPIVPALTGVVIFLCVLGVFYLGIVPAKFLQLTQLSLFY